MKIYTRTGDDGETGLFGGGRVGKDDPRVEAYGDVDELNSQLGLAAALGAGPEDTLAEIQRDLFALGADLATPSGAPAADQVARVEPDRVTWLEARIDEHDAENAPLANFVLPGGAPGAAALHVCRAVWRRAERAVVGLGAAEDVNPQAIVYLNRLSDLLFVLARRVNREEGVDEPTWGGGEQQRD
ncbi:MAG: cob(I)yrinic acid a,c-diamide adenosyltransferase [Planctomycetota bacterium]